MTNRKKRSFTKNRRKKSLKRVSSYKRLSSSPPSVSVDQINNVEVYWSPGGGCRSALLNLIESATTDILVQSYVFTDFRISQALAARSQEIPVRVILDVCGAQNSKTQLYRLKNSNAEVYIDKRHLISHNKIWVVDQQHVCTGSYNLTQSAETQNAENLVIIESPQLAHAFIKHWNYHKEHSEMFNK